MRGELHCAGCRKIPRTQARGHGRKCLRKESPAMKKAARPVGPGARRRRPARSSARPCRMGTGPGVHDPNSPFPPLPARSDVVPWTLLTAVKTRVEKNKVLPAFDQPQLALNQKTQRVQGFMMPLEPGEKQTPLPAQLGAADLRVLRARRPESMVEVKTQHAGEVHAGPGDGGGQVRRAGRRPVRPVLPHHRRGGREVGSCCANSSARSSASMNSLTLIGLVR